MPPTRRQTSSKPKALPFWAWPLFFLALWQILLSAQNPGLMSDDSGEMIAASYRMGLPHPPGYPLFNLIGYLFSFAPIGTVAFRFNLLAALLMLFSLVFILDTCRRLEVLSTRRGLLLECLLLLLGVLFASNRSVFAQCLTAKGCVYALTLLFASLLIWLRVKGFSSGPVFLLACFLWSVGMANHWQTQILWLPFLLLWPYQMKRAWNLKTALYVSTVVLAGVSLYLYLPLRAALGVLPYWGNPVTLRGFYWVVSRQLVKGSENWVQPASFYAHSARWIFQTLMFYWLPGFIFLVLIGAAVLWRKNRPFFNSLLLLFLPVFVAVALMHEERNQFLVPVYLISLAGILLVFGFSGFVWFLEKFEKNKNIFWIFLTIEAIASVGWLAYVYQIEEKSRYTLAGDFGINVLKGLPKNALLLADGDHYVMPIWYQQYAQGLRPDLVFEPSIFLYHDWGWRQLVEQSEDLRQVVYSSPLFIGRIKTLTEVSVRHPLFYSLGREYLEPVLKQVPGQWIPRGLVFEWMARAPKAKDISDRVVFALRSERFRGVEEFPDFSEMDPSTTQIYRYYALQNSVMAPFLNKLSASSPQTQK